MRSISGGGPSPGDLRTRLSLDEAGDFACTTAPLGPAKDIWTCTISPHRVQSTDALARHKTNWRELYDTPPPPGADEVLLLNARGELVEGARTNLFVARDGVLLTPPLSSGCLDGVLRRELLDQGRAAEAVLAPGDLAGEFYIGNSLRGLIPAVMPPPSPLGRR